MSQDVTAAVIAQHRAETDWDGDIDSCRCGATSPAGIAPETWWPEHVAEMLRPGVKSAFDAGYELAQWNAEFDEWPASTTRPAPPDFDKWWTARTD